MGSDILGLDPRKTQKKDPTTGRFTKTAVSKSKPKTKPKAKEKVDTSPPVEVSGVFSQAEGPIIEILQAMSSVVSSRAGSIWEIDQKEAASIAKPLCRVLAKYEAERVAKHIDEVALLMAVLGVVGPRVMITMAEAKERKQIGNESTNRVDNGRTADRGSKMGDGAVRDADWHETLSGQVHGDVVFSGL